MYLGHIQSYINHSDANELRANIGVYVGNKIDTKLLDQEQGFSHIFKGFNIVNQLEKCTAIKVTFDWSILILQKKWSNQWSFDTNYKIKLKLTMTPLSFQEMYGEPLTLANCSCSQLKKA